MIISHKYRFIFIKTLKTAGTSIEVFLSQCCGPDDVVTPIIPHVEGHIARNHRGLWNPLTEVVRNGINDLPSTARDFITARKFYNHIPARQVKYRVPESVWQQYFKFCVERNPWDKTLSHYYMLRDRSGGRLSFEEYINMDVFCLNHPKYTDARGQFLVDRVVKYESLSDELQQIFDQVGVPFEGSLGVRAKSDHRPDNRQYRDVLTDKQRKIIERVFEKEIEYHGYLY